MADLTLEGQRLLDRSPSETHRLYKKGQILNDFIKAQQGGVDINALADKRAQEWIELEQEAIRDKLTGVFNRGYIGASLAREMAIAGRHGWGLGLFFVDEDDLKSINDMEPDTHAAGDRALRTLADFLRGSAGVGGLVGRWGGDEFVLVIPECDEGKLREVGRLLGEHVGRDLAREAKLQRDFVTCSVGATLARSDETVADLIGRADAAVYKAKQGGRAQMVIEKADGSQETVRFGVDKAAVDLKKLTV